MITHLIYLIQPLTLIAGKGTKEVKKPGNASYFLNFDYQEGNTPRSLIINRLSDICVQLLSM
jgi:hypothetical protein